MVLIQVNLSDPEIPQTTSFLICIAVRIFVVGGVRIRKFTFCR